MPVRKRVPQEKIEQEQKHFSEEEVQELHALLLSEHERLTQRLEMSGDSLRSTRGAGEESADVGSDNFIRETQFNLMTEDRRRIQMIEAALEGLAHGTYGICQSCGKLIGIGRLRAKPYAKYCIDCKTIREKSGITEQEN